MESELDVVLAHERVQALLRPMPRTWASPAEVKADKTVATAEPVGEVANLKRKCSEMQSQRDKANRQLATGAATPKGEGKGNKNRNKGGGQSKGQGATQKAKKKKTKAKKNGTQPASTESKGPVPAGLPEGVSEKDGERICFGYNLGTCSEGKVGKRCQKGLHVCCHKSCGAKHKYCDHH